VPGDDGYILGRFTFRLLGGTKYRKRFRPGSRAIPKSCTTARSLLPFNNKTRRTRPRVSVVHIPPVSDEPGFLHSHS
jgi:hypothetical protein